MPKRKPLNDFRDNRSQLIRLDSLNIRRKFGGDSLEKFSKTVDDGFRQDSSNYGIF